jgi:hypothetical protein
VIQPGIESLSSSVLSLMRKGVTALINIRLLKLCAEYEFLDELVGARLMFREDDHYLGLAVCADASSIERFVAVAAEPARAEPVPAADARNQRLIPLRRNRPGAEVITDVVR